MPERFVLIDPSIKDFSGHYYRYADCVLQAAATAGLRPVLAANRRFSAPPDDRWIVQQTYQYGYWDQPRWLACPRLLAEAARNVAAGSSSGVQGTFGRAQSRLMGLLRAAAGNVFRWREHRIDQARVHLFVHDTLRLVQQLRPGPQDVCFLPTAGPVELQGLLRVLDQAAEAALASWHLVFRRDPPGSAPGTSTDRRWADVFLRLRAHPAAAQVHLYTDTEELSRQWQAVAGVPFRTLPIPHTELPRRDCRGIAAPLRVLYLGDARKEKGYHHLPRIIGDLWDDCIATGRVVFAVQSNAAQGHEDAEIRSARRALASLPSHGVAVFSEALSGEQYRTLLLSGDVVLLPYDPQSYRARSSGILVEALAAGIPPIVPADTWLARQFPATAAEELLNDGLWVPPSDEAVGVAYAHVGEIPDVIRHLIGHYECYRRGAAALAAGWVKWHNPATLLEMLLSVSQARARAASIASKAA